MLIFKSMETIFLFIIGGKASLLGKGGQKIMHFAAIFVLGFFHNYEEPFQKVKGKILVKKGYFLKFEG